MRPEFAMVQSEKQYDTGISESQTAITKGGLFSTKRHTHAESLYRITQSSNLLGKEYHPGYSKPKMEMIPLDQEEGIQYRGTFES